MKPPIGQPGVAIALALVTAIARVPFLQPGYGCDSDTWGLARAAKAIGTTGRYTASRLPGNPLQEWLSAPFWAGGPLALNGLTALASVACTLLVYRLLARTGSRDPGLGALAFAMVPAVYVASVSSIDYLWALAFILLAIDRAMSGSAALAGLFVGMATGGRLTSCVFLAPVLVVLAFGPGPRRLLPLLTASAIAAAVGAAWYVPNYLLFGTGFLSYYEPHQATHGLSDFLTGMFRPGRLPYPLVFLVGQSTTLVFGILGTLGLGAAIAFAAGARLLGRRSEPASAVPLSRPVLAASLLSIVLVVAIYLRLPHDEGYLIPTLPFLFVLLAASLPRTAFRIAAVALVLSPFVLGADLVPPKKGLTPLVRGPVVLTRKLSGQQLVVDVFRGPILQDHDKRDRAQRIFDAALPRLKALPSGSLLVAGTLAGQVFLHHWREPEFTDVAPLAEIEKRVAAGRGVYYLPDLPERTKRIFGYDLDRAGAVPLLPDAPVPEPLP